MATYQFVEGDTASKITRTCKDQDGNVIDLTGYTVRIAWTAKPNPRRSAEMTISDATNGIVEYTFADKDDLMPGKQEVNIQLENASGGKLKNLVELTINVRPCDAFRGA